MSEFEYFSAMIAVILALGVTHILSEIGQAAQKPERYGLHGYYWVHIVWVIMVFAFHLAAWWNIWGMKDGLRFSYLWFLYLLLGPTALYLSARVLVPRTGGAESVDLKHHYYGVHRLFFSLVAVFVGWPVVIGLFGTGTATWISTFQHSLLLVPVIALAIFGNRRLHEAMTACVGLLFLAIAVSGLV